MVKYLLFDLETTGLPINYKASYTYLENWPRIVQISWVVCDHNGLIDTPNIKDYIIKPVNFRIPEESTNIHRISQEDALKNGKDIKDVLSEFIIDISNCEYIVAHNLKFDKNILLSELCRLELSESIEEILNKKDICTLLETTDFCKLRPYRYGAWKWPKLSELYYILYNTTIDENKAHNSCYDVEILKLCFVRLLNKGLISNCNIKTLRNGKLYSN